MAQTSNNFEILNNYFQYFILSQFCFVFLFQWAKQVLTIEQNVRVKERLKQQKKYANILNNGEKVFIVRWKQNEKEREEFKSNKHQFEKLIKESDEINMIKNVEQKKQKDQK